MYNLFMELAKITIKKRQNKLVLEDLDYFKRDYHKIFFYRYFM